MVAISSGVTTCDQIEKYKNNGKTTATQILPQR